MTQPMRCMKCGGPMEEGFVRDLTSGSTTALQSAWIGGKPQRSLWVGIVAKGREQFPVVAYRCEGCGYLESYARVEGDE